MSELRAVDVQEIMTRAAEALSRAFGGAVKLGEVSLLSDEKRRNFIARSIAIYADGSAQPIIVKATRSPTYDPTSEKVLQTSGLAKEWVACALLAARAPGRGHGSALLAGDVANGIMVFEDLGADLGSLVHPLLKVDADEAERALKLYATALGRLHSDTVNCLDAHDYTFQSIFGSSRARHPTDRRVEMEAELVAAKIGGPLPAGELELLSSRLSNPGPWLTLIHGDPCPDNALLVDGQFRLIDYEFARPSHALLDGIYWRMGFPTCWCAGRIPNDVATRVDAIYRTEIGYSIPIALDDTAYRTELAYVSSVWLFTCLSWRLDAALKGDEKWGIWSIRGRLLWYLEVVMELTAAANVLPGIHDAAQNWQSELRKRWPQAIPLGHYPAFAANAH